MPRGEIIEIETQDDLPDLTRRRSRRGSSNKLGSTAHRSLLNPTMVTKKADDAVAAAKKKSDDDGKKGDGVVDDKTKDGAKGKDKKPEGS